MSTHRHLGITSTASGSRGPTFENRNPANTDEVVGLLVKGSPQMWRLPPTPPRRRFPAGRTCPARRAATSSIKAADILDRKFDADRGGHDSRGRQDAARSEGRGPALDQHLPLFRGRRLAHAGHAGAVRARSRPHVRASQADRRRRTDHALEFPERDSGVEARAGVDLRQYGGHQARVRRAAERVADRGGLP